MVNLDLKDKKLLYEIDFDARKTYAEIARKIGMSKRGVEYKIHNLERDKVILGYYPLINLSNLGYYYFRVFVKFRNLSKARKEAIEKYIIKDKDIGWAIWFHGNYDIGFTIWARTIGEFKEHISSFYSQFDTIITSRVESAGIKVEGYKNKYLLEKNDRESIVISEKSLEKPSYILDGIDRRLLEALIADPKISIVNASLKIKESPKVLSYHFKKLVQNKILIGVRPIINHTLLGKIYYKIWFTFNTVDEKELRRLREILSSNPRTLYIVTALGPCDLDIEMMMDSPEEIYGFVEKLQSEFKEIIKEYDIFIMDRTIKAEFLPTEQRSDKS